MSSEVLLVTIKDHIAHCCLNRPEKHNSLNKALIRQLHETIQTLSNNATVRLITFTANGSSFCAGADLNEMKNSLHKSVEENKANAMELANCLHAIKHCLKPTAAIVHGNVYGGGCGLIACCDMVIASNTSTFCFSEVKLGLTPSIISPYIVEAIGSSAARYYFLTAEAFTAERAMQLGLVHQIVKQNELSTQQQQLQQLILNNSPDALTQCKQLLRYLNNNPDEKEMLNYTTNMLVKIRTTDEAQTRLKKFLKIV